MGTQVGNPAGGRYTRPLLGFLCWMAASVAQAAIDTPPLVLEHLTTSDGLPQGTVYATLQDSQGFVWLGTEDGLVRFDGHEIVRYAYSPTTGAGLPGNFICQIAEDTHHDLWIAIKDAGIARWNRASDTFTVYRHDPANPGSLASDAANTVLVDAHGRVWVGTRDAGVDVLDPASGSIEHLHHDPADPASLSHDRIYSLAQDRAGTVWIGTEAGLDRARTGGGFEHFRHSGTDPRTLSGSEISSVLEDRGGTLWVATLDGGLNRMERNGSVTQVFRHDPLRGTSLGSDEVRALLEDQAGHLWVGTPEGLDLLDRSTGQFTHYRHDASDAESLRDSFVMSLFEDANGLIWIGTRAGGVSRWDPRSWELGGHRPKWLEDKLVTAFADAPNGQVWISSLGGGLMRFDGDSGEATDLDVILGRRHAIGDPRVMSLHQDAHGNLWIGTMTSGLRRLSADGKMESIAAKPGDPHGLSAPGVMTIYEARSGQIWIGTHGGGANVLEPSTGLIRQLPYGAQSGALSASNVTAIAEDPSGYFWVGTDGGGLDLVRADGALIKAFRHDSNDATTLPVNTVWALAVDAHGRVWVGTDGGGLAQVIGSASSPDAIRFRVVSHDQGLSSDTIYGVLADASGRLWLSGNAGLIRFDPETGALKTFHREHGLQGEEFNFNAFHRMRDGRLCFGGPGGFNVFDPSRLSESRRPPRLALTRVDVMGVILPSATPYWLLDRIAVDHRASIISMDFGALDFISPKRNRLAYRMAGLTDQWIDVGSQHHITLTNLGAGDHVLEVRAANADSDWSETPLRLTIHKEHAPWNSPWAYAAYVLAALAAILYRLRLQRRKFRQVVAARERLESEVALRTRELLESNRQLAEAAQAKSRFLDRMSHELRTPMNGVVGMTELLARTPLSPTQLRLTETIRSSAGVLLQIVNDLLDLSKIQAGKVQLESLPIDLVPLLEECASLFMGSAATKGIEIIVCPPLPFQRTLLGDPLRMRQILMNLIGNAVKFTQQGEVVVKAEICTTESDRVTVQLTVSDTGVGMDEATIARIFEPFTQADESTTRRFGGSGLGLAICRELAELLGGTIAVSSKPAVGSTFTLTLPLKVGAESGQQPAPLTARRVHIFTRRPAQALALARNVAALGLTVVENDQDGTAPGPRPGEVVIVDAGTHLDCLRTYADAAPGLRPALIVVASAAEIESSSLGTIVAGTPIVSKPVHRDALREAVSSAMGAPLFGAVSGSRATTIASDIRAHILLVEDEPVNAAVAEGYLAELGCSCVWARSGAEAIARSAAERFDLILMDLSMPLMDGFATTALIRQREGNAPHVPIVALTAHDAAGYRESCIKAGMHDLLTKPYSLQQCAEMLRRWVKGSGAPVSAAAPQPDHDAITSIDASAVATLRNLRAGKNADLYSKLVQMFRVGSTNSLTELQAALISGDLGAAAGVCHKLASSAANVGALSFAKDVRRLGQLCHAGEALAARALLDRLTGAHPALLEALTRLQLKESA